MTLDSPIPHLRACVATLWGRPEDATLPLNMRLVRLAGAMLWLVGAITLVVLAAVWPPTQRIGQAGWAVLAAAMVIALVIIVRRLRHSHASVSLSETLGSAYMGVLGIAVLEWLAGGRASPYHFLYVVPLLFVPAVHSPRRLLAFLAVLGLAMCAPLAYDGFNGAAAAEIAVQLVMLLCVAAVVRALFLILRRQSAALSDARDRAEQTARRDPLTGLGNRLAFEEAVDVEVARARRSPAGLSLIVGDLNNFKAVNDELGHLVGDRLLRHVADCLRNTARRSDECFRWGGDEFVVLLPRTHARSARRGAAHPARGCLGPDRERPAGPSGDDLRGGRARALPVELGPAGGGRRSAHRAQGQAQRGRLFRRGRHHRSGGCRGRSDERRLRAPALVARPVPSETRHALNSRGVIAVPALASGKHGRGAGLVRPK